MSQSTGHFINSNKLKCPDRDISAGKYFKSWVQTPRLFRHPWRYHQFMAFSLQYCRNPPASPNFLSPHLWKALNPKKVTVRSPERKFPRQQRNLLKKSTDDDDDDAVDCFDLRKIFLESPSQVQTKNVYKNDPLKKNCQQLNYFTINKIYS